MSLHCPTCDAPVLLADDGQLLTAAPIRCGLLSSNGTPLTVQQIKDLVRTTDLAGHSPHTCPPPGAQTSLFDLQEA